jgi:hypothetical protein
MWLSKKKRKGLCEALFAEAIWFFLMNAKMRLLRSTRNDMKKNFLDNHYIYSENYLIVQSGCYFFCRFLRFYKIVFALFFTTAGMTREVARQFPGEEDKSLER